MRARHMTRLFSQRPITCMVARIDALFTIFDSRRPIALHVLCINVRACTDEKLPSVGASAILCMASLALDQFAQDTFR